MKSVDKRNVFFKEFHNEMKKMFRLKSALMIVGILAILLGLIAILNCKKADENWRETLSAEILKNQAMAKDLMEYDDTGELAKIFDDQNKLNQYRLDHNLQPRMTIFEFAYDHANGVTIVLVLIVAVMASVSLGGEYQSGTIEHLITRNVSRNVTMAAKLLVLLMLTFYVTFSFLIISLTVSFPLLIGNGLSVTYLTLNETGNIIETNLLLNIGANLTLTIIKLLTCALFSLFVSAIVKNQTVTVVIALGFLVIGSLLSSFVPIPQDYSFIILNNCLDNIDGYISTLFRWSDPHLLYNIFTALVYDVIFICSTWLIFNNNPLKGR